MTLSKSFPPSPAASRPGASSVLRPVDWGAIAVVVLLNAVYFSATARRVTAPGFPLDDSWIHLQFARNLASGYGFSFNPGIRSSGSTAPLWTFLLVVPTLLHLNVMAAAKVLGTLLTMVTAIASAAVVARLTRSRVGGIVAGLAIALGSRFAWASVSGMEVPLYCALTAVTLLAYLRALENPEARGTAWAVLAMSIGTARPESFVFFPVLLAHWAWRRGGGTLQGAERAATPPLVTAVVVSLVYVAFNYYAGGRPLPNTFYAKSADEGLFPALARVDLGAAWYYLIEAPVRYVGILLRWSYEQAPLLTLPVLVGALSLLGALPANGAPARDGAPIVLIYLVAPAIRGAIVPEPIMLLHDGRYVAHLLVLYLLMAAAGIAWLWAHTGGKRWIVGALALAGVAEVLVQDTRYVETYAAQVKNINDLQLVTADWIRQHTAPDARIATNDIGAIGYLTGRPIVDTQGLVTPEIIPYRRSRRTADYLVQAKPDLVVIFPEWFPELKFRRDILDEIAHVTARPVVIAYGPTLVTYRTPWTRPDHVYGVQPLAPPVRLP